MGVQYATHNTERARSLGGDELVVRPANPDQTTDLALPREENRRVEQRRRLAGQVVKLDEALRDPYNPENPLALAPSFSWDKWRALHPGWSHCELRRGLSFAKVLDDGTILKTYSRDFLTELERVVATLQPLSSSRKIQVAYWYEQRGWRVGGRVDPSMELDGVSVPQGIGLGRYWPVTWTDQWGRILSHGKEPAVFTELCFNGVHEMCHCRPSDESGRGPQEYLGHSEEFGIRFGLMLDEFLRTDTTLPPNEKRAIRRLARNDEWGRPICPVHGRDWCQES